MKADRWPLRKEKHAGVAFGFLPNAPDWMMTMRMSSTRFLALIVLALVVLLTVAEFGPAVLSGR
jgi:hypothetical protein